jgi:hypothetical protein
MSEANAVVKSSSPESVPAPLPREDKLIDSDVSVVGRRRAAVVSYATVYLCVCHLPRLSIDYGFYIVEADAETGFPCGQ